MPNHYFQFKQFTIHQDKCAMKVCTDACLFGALVADKMKTAVLLDILDIGAGTGLLSLMMAQQTNAAIDAIEIDTAAYTQAKENIAQSPFTNIDITNGDILDFLPDRQYDLIISNPPFFEGDLKSSYQNKNAAKHDTTLTLDQLLTVAKTLLTSAGSFALLLPFHRLSYCMEEAEKIGLFLSQKISIKQTPKHTYFRGILFFTPQKNAVVTEEIIIKDEAGNYTAAFTALLKDYYLHL